MITTVAGLVVGIVSYISYNFLLAKIDKIVFSMENDSSEFLDNLNNFFMNLRGRNKVNPNFNMSSMTDIVFLLLIFFMLTSTLVSPNALKLLLPSSKAKTLEKQTISISINKDIHFYINENRVEESNLEQEIIEIVQKEEDPIILHADKSVDIEHVVKVMDIKLYRNKYKNCIKQLNHKMNSSNKIRIRAWIGTLLFHSLLVLLFFYTGLSYTIPPPPEEGISINFGTTELAEGETEIQQEQFEETNEESSQEVISIDETITQESIETVEKEKVKEEA